MYGRLVNRKSDQNMDQSDIKYVLELVNDAITSKDWDIVEEARETLKEFLDVDPPETDD
jgi:hypothetical protein